MTNYVVKMLKYPATVKTYPPLFVTTRTNTKWFVKFNLYVEEGGRQIWRTNHGVSLPSSLGTAFALRKTTQWPRARKNGSQYNLHSTGSIHSIV